jgi:hypothetical protein
LFTAEVNILARDHRPVRAIPELLATRYCDGDTQVYSVWLKLRVKFVNRTNKSLILDKEIGKAWYGEKVARNVDDLAAGRYEFNPNIDWVFTNKRDLPAAASTDSLGPDFAVLVPGLTFSKEIDVTVFAQYENPNSFAGSIRPGVHVLQLELSAWNHPGKASAYANSWRKLGELVTGVIDTEPLEIRIPAHPKVERDCR